MSTSSVPCRQSTGRPRAAPRHTLSDHSSQRGVKRAIVHEKLVFGLALEKLRNAVGVIRCNLQAAKNEHFKRALEQLEGAPLIVYRRHSTCLRPQTLFVK